jgi:hypothetical protein
LNLANAATRSFWRKNPCKQTFSSPIELSAIEST